MTIEPMKMMIEVPDELYRRAKALAEIRGGKIKDLVEEGLRLLVEGSQQRKGRSDLLQLMKRARGAVDSGVSDLGSNPRHLEGFGDRLRLTS
jgi:hypothetical protein